MDVVVVASSFPRRRGDHAGRFVLDASRGLAALGHRLVHVVPEAEGAPARETLGDGLEVRRVRFARTPSQRALCYGDGIGANVRGRPGLALATPRLFAALARGVDEALAERPTAALLSHWLVPCGLIASAAARRHGRAHVAVAHGGDVHLLTSTRLFRPALKRWAAGVHRAVWVSAELRARTERALGPFTPAGVVAPMGIDAARFGPRGRRAHLRARLGLGDDELVVAAVGRLVRLKGFDLLVRAVDGLDGVVVAMAGEGPERRGLERLALKLGVDVRFFGGLDAERVAGLLEAADVLAAPSRVGRRGRCEGSPMVIAEALAAGLPVIATRTGGIPERVRDGENGRLVEPGRTDGIRRALVDLAHDRALRARLAAGALVSAEACDYARTSAVLASELEAALAGAASCRTGARARERTR